eukprot:3681894-Alexandrium_andersonii.AAC.1
MQTLGYQVSANTIAYDVEFRTEVHAHGGWRATHRSDLAEAHFGRKTPPDGAQPTVLISQRRTSVASRRRVASTTAASW